MNLRDLIAAFREDIRDTKKPYLVSDRMATRFANRAECDAARRSRMLVDSTTPEICEVQVSVGESVIDIDPRIISVRRALLQSGSRPLAKRTVRQMDDEFPGWDSSSSQSVPFIVVVDYGTNQLFLYPKPRSETQLLLTVTREPLAPMEKETDSPELPGRTHDAIVAGMKSLAYSLPDPDLNSAKDAENAQAEFTAEFGPASSAADEQWALEHYDDVGER